MRLADWIERISRADFCTHGARASGPHLELRTVVSCGTAIGLAVSRSNTPTAPIEWLEDGFHRAWLRYIPLSPNSNVGSLVAEVADRPEEWTGEFPTSKRGECEKTQEAVEEVLQTFRHRAYRGLPNLHLDAGAEAPAPSILYQLALGEAPLADLQLEFETIRTLLWGWLNSNAGADAWVAETYGARAGYVQFKRLPGSRYVYAESTSRMYKEKAKAEPIPDHEATARLLGWRNDDRVPNEFAVFDAKHSRAEDLALLVLSTLLMLHGLGNSERLKISSMDSDGIVPTVVTNLKRIPLE